MRTELSGTVRESARRPSDLYVALSESVYYYDPTVLLARFLYALEKLGRRRHGHRAMRQLAEFSITEPSKFSPEDHMSGDQLQEFLFHQLLVKILVKLGKGCDQKLIGYFTMHHLHGANPRVIKDPVTLFTVLLQTGVIDKNNTKAMIEGFQEIGDHESVMYICEYCQGILLCSYFGITL